MAYEHILYDSTDGVARLTLNRPDKLNAFTAAMHAEVRDALARSRADGSRVLVITGAGRGFCAGQDLADRAVAPGERRVDLGESIEKNYAPLVLSLRRLPMPVIAAVNGVAAGAGANIALCCDLVIAARSASFIQAFSKIGLLPDSGGTWTLPRLVGNARAIGLAMLGDRLSAEEAAQWGLIWRCVDDDRLMEEATALAARLAAGPPLAQAALTRLLDESAANSFGDQLDRERDVQSRLVGSEDFAGAVEAFRDKRKPTFKGR